MASNPAAVLPAPDAASLRALMTPELTPRMLGHIDRVVALASELARAHGADVARAALTAQAHDLVRGWTDAEWIAEADRRGFDLLTLEREHPVVIHGPLGAALLAERGWVADTEVLMAVRYHTTGHPTYSPEAWAMFVADKAEPNKVARRPELQAVLDAAGRSLQHGALAYLDLLHADNEAKGTPDLPLATVTREALRIRLGVR